MPAKSRKRSRRRLAIVLSTIALGSLGGSNLPVSAQEQADGLVTAAGYYTEAQDPTKAGGAAVADPTCTVQDTLGAPPQACLDPSGLTGGTPNWPRKDNYIYVARASGQTNCGTDPACGDSIAFAAIDLGALPFGAKINSMVLNFQVENEQDYGTAGFDPADPPFRICLATEEWAPVGGGPWAETPAQDCAVTSAVQLVSQGLQPIPDPTTGTPRDRNITNMRSNILVMAKAWAASRPNFGVAFVPTEGAPDDFSVALRTPLIDGDPNAMVAKIGYTPGDDAFDFGSSDFGDSGSPSFANTGTFSGSEIPADSGPFTVDENPPAPRAFVPAANPQTPWWVWLIVPFGLGGMVLLAKAATAEVAIETGRIGPVSKLMQRRAGIG